MEVVAGVLVFILCYEIHYWRQQRRRCSNRIGINNHLSFRGFNKHSNGRFSTRLEWGANNTTGSEKKMKHTEMTLCSPMQIVPNFFSSSFFFSFNYECTYSENGNSMNNPSELHHIVLREWDMRQKEKRNTQRAREGERASMKIMEKQIRQMKKKKKKKKTVHARTLS